MEQHTVTQVAYWVFAGDVMFNTAAGACQPANCFPVALCVLCVVLFRPSVLGLVRSSGVKLRLSNCRVLMIIWLL